MAFDLWTHQFCLACDKQVHTDDGAAYCSEACRLADQERTTTTPTSSQASSPGATPTLGQGYPWSKMTTPTPTPTMLPRLARNRLCLLPAYDFHNNGQPSRAAPTHSCLGTCDMPRSERCAPCSSAVDLTPSSSHSSLCSMQSTTSSADATQLSVKSRQELKAYAISFEQVRLHRRQSY